MATKNRWVKKTSDNLGHGLEWLTEQSEPIQALKVMRCELKDLKSGEYVPGVRITCADNVVVIATVTGGREESVRLLEEQLTQGVLSAVHSHKVKTRSGRSYYTLDVFAQE